MTPQLALKWPLTDPISQDWTINELLEHLAEEPSLAELREQLLAIESAASLACGAPLWQDAPAPIALVRSLAALCRQHPELRGARLDQLLRSTSETPGPPRLRAA